MVVNFFGLGGRNICGGVGTGGGFQRNYVDLTL